MYRILVAISVTLLWASSAFAQQAVTCSQSAQTITGDPGAVVTITCPTGCGGQSVWGTGVYSDDSSMCSAAIHAGAMTSAGGSVAITIAPGQAEYPASTQNGVTSSRWGSWGRSFTVAGSSNALDCGTNAQGLAGGPGTQFTSTCPAGCGSATIWGNGSYSDDSSVCSAAIHAGVLQAATGGRIVVTIAPGQEAYPAVTANGISSSEWGTWQRSFIVGPDGGTCQTTCATSGDGECDDGGPGSLYALCPLGTDCLDCGPR